MSEPRVKLTVFDQDKTEGPAEVCLALQRHPRDGTILLHIVDPTTGEHITGGNLFTIFPDGSYEAIRGVTFGPDIHGLRARDSI